MSAQLVSPSPVHALPDSPRSMFLDMALEVMPRLLTLTCRTPTMYGHGSADREWWNNAQRVFSSPLRQCAMACLAYAYVTPHQQYYSQACLLEVARAMLDAWLRCQHRDGSFDDLYVNERAQVTTAFGLHAACEVLLLLRRELRNEAHWDAWCDGVNRACKWLAAHSDLVVANHEAGQAAALQNAGLLLGDSRWNTSADDAVERVLASQHSEGWFPEYGGADTGYLSLTIMYLIQYMQANGRVPVVPALMRGVEFLVCCSMPDGSVGGEFCSRNTAFLMPSGIMYLARKEAPAQSLLSSMLCAAQHGRLVRPADADDHLCGFFAADCWRAAQVEDAPLLPRARPAGVWRAPCAGFITYEHAGAALIASVKKNGAYVYVTSTAQRWENGGAAVELKNGAVLSTAYYDATTCSADSMDGTAAKPLLCRSARFVRAKNNTLTPLKGICLAVISLALGVFPPAALLFKVLLRRIAVTSTRTTLYTLERQISCGQDGSVLIRDSMDLPPSWQRVIYGPYMDGRFGETSRLSSAAATVPLIVFERRAECNAARHLVVCTLLTQDGVTVEACWYQ